jgi:Tfp pilus assembly protein PilF/2-polyprenyl-3-methyl-5-hydroxy-6-metoxy-1,4-benzoquinol methylase
VAFDIKMATRQAIVHYGKGDLAQVSELCRKILSIDPEHVEATHLLGVVAYHSGHYSNALHLIRKATEASNCKPEFHNNLGLVYLALGDIRQARNCYQQAITLDPDLAVAHMNLGNLMRDLGELDDAMTQYRQVLAIDPKNGRVHSYLGAVLAQQGCLDEAITHHRQALMTNPNDAEVHNNVGFVFNKCNKSAEAAVHFRRALAIDPKYVLAHVNLAHTLFGTGDSIGAAEAARRALALEETAQTRTIFAKYAASLRSIPDTGPDFCGLLVRALTEPWQRPSELTGVSVGCLKVDPAIRRCLEQVARAWPKRLSGSKLFGLSRLDRISRNALLVALLESTPVHDPELERLLTTMRFVLLQTAASYAIPGHLTVPMRLYSALAQQCFANGYIYAWTDEERCQACALRDKLARALRSGTPVPPLWLIAVAAYFPLHSLDDANALLAHSWPDGVDAVVRQQVREPHEEAELRKRIPRITTIRDDISMQVRAFYEENPYPTWVKTAVTSRQDSLRLLEQKRSCILVAGCGTGLNSIETAQAYPNAEILAVDISLACLCYALRKTREAGIDNIRYAQADVLELGSLGRNFDLVEALGVLHHLSDPWQGWRVLLSLLRPGGRMRIGLYSELARASVTASQTFFAERGYGQTVDDIRLARHDLWSACEANPLLRAVGRSADFYTLSMCRALFYAPEHRFTIPAIKAFLVENDLAFAGFDLPSPVVATYRSQFRQDQTATDLDSWHEFETKNPDTFWGMYQFSVQSRSV